MSEQEERRVEPLKAIPVSEIEFKGELLKTIYFKHAYSSYVIGVFGVACFFLKNWAGILLGLFCIGMAAVVYFAVQNHKVADIYNDNIVVYADEAATRGNRIDFEDIAEWGNKNNPNGNDAIMIKLNSGYTIYKDTFQLGSFYRTMIRLLPDKESRSVERERIRNRPLKFHNPFKDWFKK